MHFSRRALLGALPSALLRTCFPCYLLSPLRTLRLQRAYCAAVQAGPSVAEADASFVRLMSEASVLIGSELSNPYDISIAIITFG